MDNIPISKTSVMGTYKSASMAVQNPYGPTIFLKQPIAVLWKGDEASQGWAKVTNQEMDIFFPPDSRAPGEPRPDQNDPVVAVRAVTARIELRLKICNGNINYPCTATDLFLGAALGGDAAIDPGDLRYLANGGRGKPNADGIFPWDKYLFNSKLENGPHDLKVIQQFVNNVNYLQKQGAAVPDVNWTFVCGLLDNQRQIPPQH
jgi:hypothetical protein